MEDIKDIESSKIEEYLSKLGDWALNKGFQLVLAIICMYIGMKLSKLIVKMIRKSFKKSNMEESVASFLLSLIKFTFYAIVFIYCRISGDIVSYDSWYCQFSNRSCATG